MQSLQTYVHISWWNPAACCLPTTQWCLPLSEASEEWLSQAKGPPTGDYVLALHEQISLNTQVSLNVQIFSLVDIPPWFSSKSLFLRRNNEKPNSTYKKNLGCQLIYNLWKNGTCKSNSWKTKWLVSCIAHFLLSIPGYCWVYWATIGLSHCNLF